jgi:SAM-dependent methyltransferase
MTASVRTPRAGTEPWPALLDSWDVQQAGYLPRREDRFTIMATTVADLVGSEFTVLDLGCGPGSLIERILTAYPAARGVAVDTDPVLLRIGQECLGDLGGRLRWIDADLREEHWADAAGLAPGGLDAIVSTTALHWLDPGALYRLYATAASLLRPGGVFVNGDNMTYDHGQTRLRELTRLAETRSQDEAFTERGVPDWSRWWEGARAVPELAEAFTERARRGEAAKARFGDRAGAGITGLRTHVAALREAGFAEADTVWQLLDDRVLVAVRAEASPG